MPSRVLVTGAAGFIGRHLVDRLLARGDRVVGIDTSDPFYPREEKERNLEAAQANAGFRLIEVDCADPAGLDRALDHEDSTSSSTWRPKPECVRHWSIRSLGRRETCSGRTPTLARPTGCSGTLRPSGWKRVFHASSTGCARTYDQADPRGAINCARASRVGDRERRDA